MRAGGSRSLEGIVSGECLPSASELFQQLPSHSACAELIMRATPAWSQCPYCQSAGIWERRSARVFRCRKCRKHVSPTQNTMFANSSLDLRFAFFASLIFCQSRRLVSAAQLPDMLGISGLASQLIRNKIWNRLAEIAPPGRIGGPGVSVEIDELLVSRYIRTRSSDARYNVLGITDRSICRVFLLPDRKKSTLMPIIREHVAPGSIINTDGWTSYRGLEAEGYSHLWCNHSKGIFKGFDGATTTFIDGYWRELKLSLAITHNGISEARAPTFFAAHACRYSFRDSPVDLFWSLVGCRPGDLCEIVARQHGCESLSNYRDSHAGRNGSPGILTFCRASKGPGSGCRTCRRGVLEVAPSAVPPTGRPTRPIRGFAAWGADFDGPPDPVRHSKSPRCPSTPGLP